MTADGKRRDGYVRIPTSELFTVQLRHLFSEKDPTIEVLDGPAEGGEVMAGITEWTGTWQNQTVTVGWDWCVLQRREVVVLVNPKEIRTNIKLVRPDGKAEDPAIATIHLINWIESHPWREAAQAVMAKEDDD